MLSNCFVFYLYLHNRNSNFMNWFSFTCLESASELLLFGGTPGLLLFGGTPGLLLLGGALELGLSGGS